MYTCVWLCVFLFVYMCVCGRILFPFSLRSWQLHFFSMSSSTDDAPARLVAYFPLNSFNFLHGWRYLQAWKCLETLQSPMLPTRSCHLCLCVWGGGRGEWNMTVVVWILVAAKYHHSHRHLRSWMNFDAIFGCSAAPGWLWEKVTKPHCFMRFHDVYGRDGTWWSQLDRKAKSKKNT